MKKVNYKWMLIVVLVYAIIVLAILFGYKKVKGTEGYLILSEDAIYYRSNNEWIRYYENIPSPVPVVVSTENGIKDLSITNIKGKLEYYQDESQIKLDEPLKIAYTKKLNLDFKDYDLEDIHVTEIKKFDEILKEHDIMGYEHLSSSKLVYDFNHDGINDTIYFATNLFLETTYDKVFSFAYYIKNNKPIYLSEQVGNLDEIYELCIPKVKSIVNLDNDQKDELILECDYFDNIGVDYSFYQYENNEFIRMKGV